MKREIIIAALSVTFLLSAIIFGKKEDEKEKIIIPKNVTINEEDVIYKNGELLVDSQILLTSQGDNFKKIEKMVKKENGEIIGYIPFSGDYHIEFSQKKSYEELSRICEKWEEKDFVEQVSFHTVLLAATDAVDFDNDSWLNDGKTSDEAVEWDELNPGGTNWWAEAIRMPTVWNMNTWEKEAEKNIRIGLIDTVFDVEHEELDSVFKKTWQNINPSEESINLDEKDKKHGTHVAGIMTAEMGNDCGISGVASCVNPQLYGFSLNGNKEQVYTSMMQWKYAIALMLAEDVKVINVSMGFEEMLFSAQRGNERALITLEYMSNEMENFLKKAISAGYEFVIVKSAGNTSGIMWKECKEDEEHPYGIRKHRTGVGGIQEVCSSKYDILGAITDETVRARIVIVGAAKQSAISNHIGRTGYKRAGFSNTDADVYAPGVGILSCIPGGRNTGELDGTSQATPIVAGVAALIWSVNPELSSEQVKEILIASSNYSAIGVDPVGDISASDDEVSIINAAFAVNMAKGMRGTFESEKNTNTIPLMGIIYTTSKNDKGENVNTGVGDAKITIYSHEEEKEVSTVLSGPFGEFDFFLKPGAYSVAVEAKEYQGKTITLEVGENAVYLSVCLQKESGMFLQYAEVLEKYIDSFPWENNGRDPMIPEMSNASYLYMYHDVLDEIGYALIDINEDGVDELLIGEVGEKNSMMYDAYTIVNGRALQILSSGERSRYHLCTEGNIVLESSSSAANSNYEKYIFDGYKLQFQEMVTYDGFYAEEIGLIDNAFDEEGDKCWFFSKSNRYGEGYRHITEKEAKEKLDSYKRSYTSIGYIPLSVFENVNKTKNQQVNRIVFNAMCDEGMEYAIITAYNKENKQLWKYTTPEYSQTDLERVSEIGHKGDKYYFVQDRAVVALDSQTGKILWINNEFEGSGTYAVIGDDAIYLCGQYGPDFFAVSFDGRTLCKIRQFHESYYWAQSIELNDTQAIVYLHGGTEDYENPVAFTVDLSSYEVNLVQNDS